MKMEKLKEKVAIITGGSRGIGKGITNVFLLEGARVIIAARSKSKIKETIENLRYKGEIIGVVTDVSDETQVKRLINKTMESFGNIDILINAAGVQAPIGPLIDINVQEWVKNIRINLIGTMLCCKTVLPIMIKKRKGKIINFSGGGATSPRPYFSAYAVSKVGVVKLTEILAQEVKEYGIDVNAIAPGVVNTRMLDEIIQAKEKAGSKEAREAIMRKKKGATLPEVAGELAVFLASEESNGLTGRLISAVWDDWKDVNFKNMLMKDYDWGTLRRIDRRNFERIK